MDTEPATQERPRRKKTGRIVWLLLFSLLVLTGLSVSWLASGVRTLDFLKPHIQQGLGEAFDPCRVAAETIHYKADIGDMALVTNLGGVTFFDEQGKPVAQLEKVNLDISLLSLLSGKVSFKTLEVVRPSIHLFADADGGISMSVSSREDSKETDVAEPSIDEREAAIPLGGFMAFLKEQSVKTLLIRDAFLSIDSPKVTAMYQVPRLMLLTQDEGDAIALKYDLQVKEVEAISRLTGAIEMDEARDHVRVRGELEDFNLRLLAPFHAYGVYLVQANVKLDGSLMAALSGQGELIDASADLYIENGTYAHPDLLPETLRLDALSIKARMAEKNTVQIEEISLKNQDMNLRAEGNLVMAAGDIGAQMNATVENLPLERIGAYWPKGLSEDAREWVTSNLTVGTVTKAEATLSMPPGALEAEETPEDLLDATINVSNASVEYLPDFPLITGVNGTATITAKSIDIRAKTGNSMRGTKLKTARWGIPDFGATGMPMILELDVTAPAADVAELIGPQYLDLASALKLDPERITGSAAGQVELSLPLYSAEWPKNKPYVTYDIDATLENVTQSGVLDKWNFANMSGTLAVNNAGLALQTDTVMQEVDAALGVKRSFAGTEKTDYTLVAEIPHNKLSEFGFEAPRQITGVLGVDAVVNEENNVSVTTANIDLGQAAIAIPDINYYKDTGVPATLKIAQKTQGNLQVIPDFSYSSEGAEATGSLTQNLETEELESLKLTKFKLGANDLLLHYSTEGGRRFITIQGQTLDLSGEEENPQEETQAADSAEKKPDENPLEQLMNTRIELDLKRLLLSSDKGLNNLKGHIDCGQRLCSSVELNANTDPKNVPLNISIVTTGNGREFSLFSDDAGSVTDALDISEHVKGGALNMNGVFDDSSAEPVLNAQLSINDFRVVKAPVLAKLLSLASLTGVLDVLSGKGIAFIKLSSDIRYSDGVLILKKGKAYGSAIGLTAEGKIRPFAGTLNLEGTVVPAYAANSVLGNIPVIGTLLTGGEGSGIIAANYSMKGESDDPNILVNPLSLLTPGFTRNLFDVFDAPEKGDEESVPDKDGASRTPAGNNDLTPDQPAFPSAPRR